MAEATKTPAARKKEERSDLTPQEAKLKAMSIEERREYIAQVLSRGLVDHRLEAVGERDPNRRYVWVRDREMDIDKFLSLGYRIETSEDGEEGTHGKGDTRIQLGDTILMSTLRENYDLMKEVELEQKRRRRGAGKREYLDRARQHDVPIIGDNEEV